MNVLQRWIGMAVLAGVLPMGAIAQVTPSKTTQATAAAQSAADKIDINSASADQLKSIPGIGDAYAKRIIDGRPYANKTQLTTKGVLPQGVYDKIKDRVVATQAKKK